MQWKHRFNLGDNFWYLWWEYPRKISWKEYPYLSDAICKKQESWYQNSDFGIFPHFSSLGKHSLSHTPFDYKKLLKYRQLSHPHFSLNFIQNHFLLTVFHDFYYHLTASTLFLVHILKRWKMSRQSWRCSHRLLGSGVLWDWDWIGFWGYKNFRIKF